MYWGCERIAIMMVKLKDLNKGTVLNKVNIIRQ